LTTAVVARGVASGPARFEWIRRLLRNRLSRLAALLLALVLLTTLLAAWLTPYDPTMIDLASALQGPGPAHPLGTDQLGRDSLARLLYGGQISLLIGVTCVLVAAGFGVALGLIAGYFRPTATLPIIAVSDLLLAFPTLLFAIFLVATIGASVTTLILAIGIREVPVYVRLVRSLVMSLKEAEFVQAARSVGARDARIMARHIFPNTVGVVVVQSTFLVARAVITAAGLGFLGLGVPAPTPEWGVMLADARPYLAAQPRLMLLPGVMLMLTVLALNVLGDAIRDVLDPRMKNVGA
jgi:ABC-type dipeptide/oligopeptide/nickel transport system permease subunit